MRNIIVAERTARVGRANAQERATAVALSHVIQQKVCAIVLQAELIERALAGHIDPAAIREMARRIKEVGYEAGRTIRDVQQLTAGGSSGELDRTNVARPRAGASFTSAHLVKAAL